MKKIVSYLLACMMMLTVMAVPTYDTYGAGISLSVSASSVNIGDTVTVTVSVPSGVTATVDVYFPTDLFAFVNASGTTNVNGGTVATTLGDPFASSVTIKLKAKTTGTATISASVIKAGDNNNVDADGNPTSITLSGASKSVTIENKTVEEPDTGSSEQPEAPKSADNSLSSLKISAGTLSPSFKGNVTKYTATVNYDVTKLVVSAKLSNSKATIESVTGNGNVALKVGENTIKIVVKAENGVQATYTIIVTRKEKETTSSQSPESETPNKPPETEQPTQTQDEKPTFEYNGQKMNIIEEIPQETIPADFTKETILVEGKETTGLRFSKGELELLYLANQAGYGSLYVYDKAEQDIYPLIKLASEKNYIIVLRPNNTNVPAGFTPCTLSIEGKGTVEAYRYKEQPNEQETETIGLFGAETYFAEQPVASDFYLLYCVNSSGETGWYQFDSVEGTFQRYLGAIGFDDETVDVNATPQNGQEAQIEALKNQQKMIVAILGGVCLLLLIAVISLTISKNKLLKEYNKAYLSEQEPKQEETLSVAKKNEVPVVETANASYLEKMIGAYTASEEELETVLSTKQENAEQNDSDKLEDVKSEIEVVLSDISQKSIQKEESVEEIINEIETEDEVDVEFFEISEETIEEELGEIESEDEVDVEFFEIPEEAMEEELGETESEDEVDVEFFEIPEEAMEEELSEIESEDEVDMEFFEIPEEAMEEELSEIESENEADFENRTEISDISNKIIIETTLSEPKSEEEIQIEFFEMSDELLAEATVELKNEINDTFFENKIKSVEASEFVKMEDESEDEVEVEFFEMSDEIIEDIEKNESVESEDKMEFLGATEEKEQETEAIQNKNQSDSDDEDDDDLEFIDL